VQNGLLGGSGSTLGVNATAGTVSPGDNGAGILTVNGALTLNAGVTVSLDILGAAPGTLHDALRVTNGVSLGSATLALTGNFLGPTNQTFTIIDNTSGGAISGTFLNLPEGATFAAPNGVSYRITYVGGTGNDVVLTQVGKSPIRLEGPDRIDTAIAVSKNSFPTAGSANAVVLARGDLFPDALAGSPLAVNKGGPLLLTASGALDPRTLAEIQRVLTPGKPLFVLGETVAISQAIQNQLSTLGYLVTRLGGADRFETAVRIASIGLGNPATILLATGLNFPDALSGGAAAAKVSGAILLTNGTTQAPATSAYLASRASATVFALGGPAAAAQPTASAIIGVDRYATAVQVAQRFFVSPNPANVGLASGTNFPDGLTGGAHIGKLGGPMLLTDPNALPAIVNSYLVGINATITGAFIYGGPAAVSANVASQYRTAIGG
jgi:putative cell wall-binding protein